MTRSPRLRRLNEVAMSLGSLDAETKDRALRLSAEPFLRADDRGLALLAAVAVLSPLLGLFGTVVGMIEMFRSLAASGARPEFSSLVGGIWTALLTTAFGLIAAIPAQAAHYFFDHAADRRARVLQEYSGRLGLAT
jgi:biopolymer transport protein ExbB